MYSLLKPLLFRLDPERAHHLTTYTLLILLKIPGMKWLFSFFYGGTESRHKKRVMGIDFNNSVGLAAGFDKDAQYIDAMSTLGFGFIEIGTITPKAQEGNDTPRLFRLPTDKALINRMGFNNKGLEEAIVNLKSRKTSVIVGGNIGKNKVTPNELAYEDYKKGLEQLYPWVDYFVVNVSSPNTPGLRSLQDKEPLRKILSSLIDLRSKKKEIKPILLKIAPDLTDGQRQDIADLILELNLEGLVSCNTTISREGLSETKTRIESIGNGGLSGDPLYSRSLKQVVWFREALGKEKVIIGVGGINSAHRAEEMLEAGADLIQIYSGLIYEGPSLVKRILKNT